MGDVDRCRAPFEHTRGAYPVLARPENHTDRPPFFQGKMAAVMRMASVAPVRGAAKLSKASRTRTATLAAPKGLRGASLKVRAAADVDTRGWNGHTAAMVPLGLGRVVALCGRSSLATTLSS